MLPGQPAPATPQPAPPAPSAPPSAQPGDIGVRFAETSQGGGTLTLTNHASGAMDSWRLYIHFGGNGWFRSVTGDAVISFSQGTPRPRRAAGRSARARACNSSGRSTVTQARSSAH
ncbi:hypothetical protein [Yinghuangia seranimata]|uniref:hypothetical protein n=1 Tax=Yinghuangia seranimata TaxID=408067 RepID=UPI00248BF02F|nr:hypothetical protein [Yinghuangia seranimata]MDI2131988.1 hypothetical protein [Yinghuangia seranimata]